MTEGKPISEAPRDGTVILMESMNYAGVPATGGYGFRRVKWDKHSWLEVRADMPSNCTSYCGDGLRWWPGDTDPATLTLTPRTNWNFIPSNGSHGDAIYDSWCATCIHERAVRENSEHAFANGLGCDILARTMAFGIGDAKYPTEWTYDRTTGEPKCTARVEDTGQAMPELRCQATIDMFAR